MSLVIEPSEQSCASIKQCRLAVGPASAHGSQFRLPAMAAQAPMRRCQIRPTTKIRLRHQRLLSVPHRREPVLCGYPQMPRRIS